MPELDQPELPNPLMPISEHPAAPKTNALSGPLGLRAGWGILLFFLLTVGLAFVLLAGLFKGTGQLAGYRAEQHQAQQATAVAKAAHQPAPQRAAKVSYVLLAEMAESGAVLAAAFGISFLEKRRFAVYGLTLRRFRDVVPGALWGLLAISVLIGVLRALHLLVFDRQLLSGGAILRYGLVWLLTFVLVGLFEEFLFRGYIQFTLTRGLLRLGAKISPNHVRAAAFCLAALTWSLFFCITHMGNAGEDPMGIVMVFVAGMLFSYALWKTGSLWWGIGFHMTWDWGQSFLFGVPDSGNLSAGRLFATHPSGHALLSGGMDGPEGSILVLPVLLLVAIVLRMHPASEQPPVEPTSLPLVRGSAAPKLIP